MVTALRATGPRCSTNSPSKLSLVSLKLAAIDRRCSGARRSTGQDRTLPAILAARLNGSGPLPFFDARRGDAMPRLSVLIAPAQASESGLATLVGSLLADPSLDLEIVTTARRPNCPKPAMYA